MGGSTRRVGRVGWVGWVGMGVLGLALVLAAPAAAETGGDEDPRGLCESDQPICELATGLDPVVTLRWQEFSAPGGKRRTLRNPNPKRFRDIGGKRRATIRGDVQLLAENQSDRPIRIHVTLHPWGLRSARDLPEYELSVGPRASVPVPIDVEGLGLDMSQAKALAGVRAVVTSYAELNASSDPANRIGQTISPMLYFQKRNPRARSMWAFDESQLDRLVNRASRQPFSNPFCTEAIPPDDDGEEEELELVIDGGSGDPEPGQDFTVDPPADGNLTFCFALPVHTVDSGIGEDFGTNPVTNYPASHAQVTITSLPPQSSTVVDEQFLDEDGCVSFPHDSPEGYFVKLTGRAQVPRSDLPAESNLLEIRTEGNQTPAWYWCSDEDLEAPDVKWFYANPNRRTNLLALATFSLRRFSDGVGGETIFVLDEPCGSSPTNSCNTGTGQVQVHPDHNQFRYAVSHEVGHAVIHRFLGTGHPLLCGAYAVNGGGSACEFDLSHALHSKEFSSAAMTEGFAQFYATAVYNRLDQTQGWFHYYKEDYKDGAVTVVDMESDLVGGTVAYLDTICEGPKEGFGVELDWARQFWDYMTDAGVKPTRLQLMEQLKLAYDSEDIVPAWNNGNSSDRMTKATEEHANGDYAQRWADLAVANGIDAPTFSDSCDWFCFPACTQDCTEDSCNCSNCDP